MSSEKQTSRGSVTRRSIVGAGMLAGGAAALGLGLLASRKGGAIVPGVSRARRVQSGDRVPESADVVVVGGGNIGCFTALELAERGVKVVLCEKGVIAGEASGRSLGYVDSLMLDPVKVEIVSRSKQLWEGLNTRVGAESGFRRTGIAVLFDTEEGVEFARQQVKAAAGTPGADSVVLGAKEAMALAPGCSDPIAGALFNPSDGIAEPQLAAPAVADQVQRLGGIVLQNCAVRGIETHGARVSGVVTEKGSIRCGSVVVCGGIWSPLFLRSMGIDLPQFMAFGSAMRFAASDGPTVGLISIRRNVVMRRGLQGTYDICKPVASAPVTPTTLRNLFRLMPAWRNLGDQLEPVLNLATFISQWRIPRHWPLDRPSPFESCRVFEPEIRGDMLDDVAREMRGAFPAIGARKELERWAGAMMTTLDNMPVISAVDGHPGLFAGSGFYYGLTMAPAAGEALADLVMNRKPHIDLSLYRLARFSDGSPIQFRA